MPTFTGIFKEIPIDSKLCVPPQKPPMECILDTNVTIDIDKAAVIDTPLRYPENPALELRKVIVTGIAHIIVKYSADVPDQRVHAAHFDVPFCTLIEWPGGPPQGTPITVRPVIERAVFRQEDGRRIFKAILVRLDVYR